MVAPLPLSVTVPSTHSEPNCSRLVEVAVCVERTPMT